MSVRTASTNLPPGIDQSFAARQYSASGGQREPRDNQHDRQHRAPRDLPRIRKQLHQRSHCRTFLYNSAQVTLRKQMSHGLLFQAAYTFSRGFTATPEGYGNPGVTAAGQYPEATLYVPNAAYHPQRLAVSYSYDLPFGHHSGLVGKATEGWTVSGITIIQDGTPLTVTDSRLGTIFGGGNTAAQFCGGATLSQIETPGSLFDRVVSGLTNGNGYINKTPFASPNATGGNIINCPQYFPGADGCGLCPRNRVAQPIRVCLRQRYGRWQRTCGRIPRARPVQHRRHAPEINQGGRPPGRRHADLPCGIPERLQPPAIQQSDRGHGRFAREDHQRIGEPAAHPVRSEVSVLRANQTQLERFEGRRTTACPLLLPRPLPGFHPAAHRPAHRSENRGG